MNAEIKQVFNVSDNMLMDCYYIANLVRPQNAEQIYYGLQREINNCNHIMFSCCINNILCGFIKGHNTLDGQSRIDWLFVDKGRRRCGIGSRLIEAYEEFCRGGGITHLLVERAPTLQAKNFYEKKGFYNRGSAFVHEKYLTR